MGAELRVRIIGDGSSLSQTFAAAKTQAGAFANSIKTSVLGSISSQFASLLSVGMITGLSAKTISFAGHMRDLADTIKANVEWLQKMRNAAVATGATEDDFGKMMIRIQQSRQAAANNPTGKQGQAFSRMGFSSGEISGRNSLNTQAFVEKMIQALANGANENDIATVGSRAAFKMLNAFRQGIDSGGPVISEDLIDQLDDIGDEFEILKTQLMVDIAPAIVFVVNSLKSFKGIISEVAAAAGGYVGTRNTPGLVGDVLDQTITGGNIGKIMGMLGMTTQNEKDAQVAAGEAAGAVESKNRETDEQIRTRRESERKARRSREQAGPNFELDAPKESKFKVEKVSTDALSKSGLFTASGLLAKPSPIEQQQLDVLRRIEQNTSLIEPPPDYFGD